MFIINIDLVGTTDFSYVQYQFQNAAKPLSTNNYLLVKLCFGKCVFCVYSILVH